jgi:predicted lipid-binding transport protein (Tim44 family)
LLFNLLPWPLKLILIIIVIVVAIRASRSKSGMADWSTVPAGGAGQQGGYAPSSVEPPRVTLGRLRQLDPTFSLVLFEDFLYALYAEAHQRRVAGQLDMLSAYLSPEVIAQLNRAPREPIQGVVIGAMRYLDASIEGEGPAAMATVGIELEVNLTVLGANGPASAYLVERWTLARRAGAKSRPADRARIFDCPNCGAPQSAVMAGHCTHCKQAVSTGDFGWVVRSADVVNYEQRPPLLTSDVAEEGTNLATIIDPGARQGLDALWQRDQSFQWPAFEQRVGLIFNEFQTAWSNRDLAKMRPFLSDNLFQMQSYWVEAYKLQRLRNVTENARISGIELARVDSDASFDALTVRVYASSLDYTVTDEGKLVTGSKSRERKYTEYWTLIRGSGRKGPTKTEPVCPNCGAPLAINMAGTCTYCQAKVTTGEFDWVLSRIEQDEAYTG